MNTNKMTRAALLLALTLVFQSLRFVLPLPPFASTVLIGSLVNAGLLITVETAGLWPAVIIAVCTPLMAYLQQLLPLPVFILPVAAGNLLYVFLYALLMKRRWVATISAAIAKSLALYLCFLWLLSHIAIPPKLAGSLLFIMSWPQLLTGIAGGMIAMLIVKRLASINKA
jgi:hypothetical protein